MKDLIDEVDSLVDMIQDDNKQGYAGAVEESYEKIEKIDGGIELLEFAIRLLNSSDYLTRCRWNFQHYKNQAWIQVFNLDEEPTSRGDRWWLKKLNKIT